MSQGTILQIFRERYTYGVSKAYLKGLNVSSMLTHFELEKRGFYSDFVGCADDNGIDRVMYYRRPTHAILNAFWYRPEKIDVLAKKYRGARFFLRCHSKINFLGMEGNGIKRLNEYINVANENENVFVAANSKDLCDEIETIYKHNMVYIPNLYYTPCCRKQAEGFSFRDKREEINVGLFCAMRPFKNVLTQAVAAIMLGDTLGYKINLHVITGRQEMGGHLVTNGLNQLFENIDHKKAELIEYPWMDYSNFIHLVAKMDIGLQVSYTESFNIIAADFISCGCPVVTSSAIKYMPKSWNADPDNASDIAQKMFDWLSCSRIIKNISLWNGKRHIKKWNDAAQLEYENLLKY